jgi:hypothetical protein
VTTDAIAGVNLHRRGDAPTTLGLGAPSHTVKSIGALYFGCKRAQAFRILRFGVLGDVIPKEGVAGRTTSITSSRRGPSPSRQRRRAYRSRPVDFGWIIRAGVRYCRTMDLRLDSLATLIGYGRD